MEKLDLEDHEENIEDIEVRRIQALAGERTLTLVFPKIFATKLGIVKGDFVKCHVDGHRLMVEKLST